MKTFKEFMMMTESKAIVFPPEIQDKLNDIAEKMITALAEVDKEEVEPKGEKFKYVDSIVFNDPYTKKERKYNFYASKPGKENESANHGGYHNNNDPNNPHIVVTTNSRRSIIMIYQILAHELAHAYDPTLTKGYRRKNNFYNTDEYKELDDKLWKSWDDVTDHFGLRSQYFQSDPAKDNKEKKGIFDRIKTLFGYGKTTPTPEERWQLDLAKKKEIKDKNTELRDKYVQEKKKEKTKLTPYFHPSENDGTIEGKRKAFDKYFEQEPEFLANISALANSIIFLARNITKGNNSPDSIFLKKYFIFDNLISHIKSKDKYDFSANPFLSYFFNRYFARYKNKPKLYRKLLEKASNAALEARNIIDQYIKDNKLEISPEVENWIKQDGGKTSMYINDINSPEWEKIAQRIKSG